MAHCDVRKDIFSGRNLSEVGEKKFVTMLLKLLSAPDILVNGFGHDASVIDIGLDNIMLVLKIDRTATPIAVAKRLAGYGLFGKLSVVSNFSDILATGGLPKCFLLSISAPRDFSADRALEIILEAEKTAKQYGAFLVGGDTKEAREIHIVGAALGIVMRDCYITRSGARPGDIVAVTGELGSFFSGVVNLLKNNHSSKLESRFVEPLVNPKPAFIEAKLVSEQRTCTSGMDLSDGLSDALYSISEHSNVGMEIDLDKLPISDLALDTSQKFNIPPLNFAFSVGDWNILYTIRESSWSELSKKIEEQGGKITKIGRITRKKKVVGCHDKKKSKIKLIKNEHFTTSFEDNMKYVESVIDARPIDRPEESKSKIRR